MSKTIPNQILHYTASSIGYPPQAIRVGNFALSDAGNNPTGAWGTFRGGVNPPAFTTDQGGSTGFEKQTYTVYIYRPNSGANCFGPSAYLIGNGKQIPNSTDPYPGDPDPVNPWYNLIKFTQYIVGSVSGSITSQIGYYDEVLDSSYSNSNTKLLKTFQWYSDQLVTGDANSYLGGTAGNRVVVNKFYPPIIANTASRIFDSSYIPSFPTILLGSNLSVSPANKIFNLAGLTHASMALQEMGINWDFEGGFIKTVDPLGLGTTGTMSFTIPMDAGFQLAGIGEPNFWTLNMYVMVTNANNDYTNWFISSRNTSPANTGNIDAFWGLGYRNFSGTTKLTYTHCSGGAGREDTEINPGTMSHNRWYFISVVRQKNSDYKFYFNGKFLSSRTPSTDSTWDTVNPSTTAAVLFSSNSDIATARQENAYKNFQYLSYYPGNYGDDDIRENFLRYALNSKIRNSNIKIALDTGTKASHQGSTEWIDISGNDLHGTTGTFNWQGHKPGYTRKQVTITHQSIINNFFTSPFCLSLWVRFGNAGTNSGIFSKGRNTIGLGSSLISVDFRKQDNGLSGKWVFTSTTVSSNKWYNIFVTGLNLSVADVYIFSHSGSTQELISGSLTEASSGDPTVDDTSNILVGDPNENIDIASVIYWNSRFSEKLCNDFFAIQKGRFGYDSNENRIAPIGECV
jgi:hypothetical protein